MSLPKPSPDETVACVMRAWQNAESEDAVVAQLVTLGLRPDEAEQAVELVQSGIGRAALLAAGLPTDQISSDVDDNAVFLAAVKAGRAALAEIPPEEPADFGTLSASLASDDTQTRRKAAYELGKSRDPSAVGQLLAALDDTDLYVRVYAIQSLKDLRAQQAVAPCCRLLGSDAPKIVLVNAIKALVEIGDSTAVPALIEATRHEDAFVRHDAAWALGELRDSRAIPALEALLNDTTIPVEKDGLGLTVQTSSYSVADHAKQSLKRIRGAAPRSARHDWALSIAWTAVGAAVLAITGYAYFAHDSLSKLALACGSLVLIVGLLGLFGPKGKSDRGQPAQ